MVRSLERVAVGAQLEAQSSQMVGWKSRRAPFGLRTPAEASGTISWGSEQRASGPTMMPGGAAKPVLPSRLVTQRPARVALGSETLVKRSEMPVTTGWSEARRRVRLAPAPLRAGYLPEP